MAMCSPDILSCESEDSGIESNEVMRYARVGSSDAAMARALPLIYAEWVAVGRDFRHTPCGPSSKPGHQLALSTVGCVALSPRILTPTSTSTPRFVSLHTFLQKFGKV
jgi:hypothetical protein